MLLFPVCLSKLTLINPQDKLIYEAFAQEHPNSDYVNFNVKPLKEIIVNFCRLAQKKLVVCHNAQTDIQNLDFEVELEDALTVLNSYFNQYWLVQTLGIH